MASVAEFKEKSLQLLSDYFNFDDSHYMVTQEINEESKNGIFKI